MIGIASVTIFVEMWDVIRRDFVKARYIVDRLSNHKIVL